MENNDSAVYAKLEIPGRDWTQEAFSFFQIIKEKLTELSIEPNEAGEFFRQFTGKIQETGFIPPLILNFLRDIHGNYQTLIISRNLSPEEERIIAACIKPNITGSNEVVQQRENIERLPLSRNAAVLGSNPFSDILTEIYSIVFQYTHENQRLAQELTEKAQHALKKLISPPIQAVRRPPRMTPAMFEQFKLQANPKGILNYLQEQARIISKDTTRLLPKKDRQD